MSCACRANCAISGGAVRPARTGLAERSVSGVLGHYRFPVRIVWLPVSAASLVVGATGLFYGAQTMPRPDGEGEVIEFVVSGPDGLLSPAVVMLLGASALVMGLPALHSLYARSPRAVVGVVGTALIALGSITIAGFAQQLMMLRNVVTLVGPENVHFPTLMDDAVQGGLLQGAYVSFLLGELLLAWTLWGTERIPRWLPVLLVLHPLTLLAEFTVGWGGFPALPAAFMAASLASIGILANVNDQPTGSSSREVAERHAREGSD